MRMDLICYWLNSSHDDMTAADNFFDRWDLNTATQMERNTKETMLKKITAYELFR